MKGNKPGLSLANFKNSTSPATGLKKNRSKKCNNVQELKEGSISGV